MHSRTVKNAAWIIGCRLVQAVIGLAVTMISARYLGPSGYGLINYAASLVTFFVPIMQLGLNSTLVQEILNKPEQEGETMGTALVLTFVSGIACVIGVGAFSAFANQGETQTIFVCVLYSLLLLAQSLEMIQYWFQAKLLSKYTALTVLAAYIAISIYRITLLVAGKSIYWYAVSQAIDYAIIAIALLFIYNRLPTQKLRFSLTRANEIFGRSKHYIISAMMITVFAQTDRVMLKIMIDEAAVGYYSAAITCAGLSSFVFVAIIDSARPTILNGKKKSDEVFQYRLKLLFTLVIGLALLQSAAFTILSNLVIGILYGSAYAPSVSALRIVVWYTTFSYLGAVRDIWILAENKQKYLWIINLSGASVNICLNAFMIPVYGINGAAAASLITQIFTNVMMGFILKPIRPCNRLMLQSLNVRLFFVQVKELRKRNGKYGKL